MPTFLRNRWTWIGAAVVAVIAGIAWMMMAQSAAKQAKEKAAAKAPPSPYAAVASGKADVEGGIIQIAARTAGIVREVVAQEGDTVTKGQVLARLEDDQPKLAVQSARAAVEQAETQIRLQKVNLDAAKREYNRILGLKSKQFISGQALDQAQDLIRQTEAQIAAQEAAVATAKAQLAQAAYQLELTVIRAPVNGKIVRRYANPGSGASTLNVSNMFDLEPDTARIVRAEIVESAIPFVQIGQEVEVAAEADGSHVYVGKVKREAPVFGARKLQSDDPAERTDDRVVEVVVSADNAPLLIGQRVLVRFMKPGQQAGAQRPAPAPPAAKPAA